MTDDHDKSSALNTDKARRFTTRAQAALHRGGRRRFAWAALAAAVFLGLLIWLGPSQESVKKRFELYGAPGEMQIMPEISIDDGSDAAHQIPKSLQTPPPPSRIEVEKEVTEDGTEPVPKPNEVVPNVVNALSEHEQPDSETVAEDQVELNLPRQSNPDWFIKKMIRPSYPADAPEHERRTPLIFVKVGVFVDPQGQVTATMVTNTNGSKIYSDEVLQAVEQWLFGWKVDPGAGRWIEMTWNFRSPYFHPGFTGSGDSR